jgi:hypothetical protein
MLHRALKTSGVAVQGGSEQLDQARASAEPSRPRRVAGGQGRACTTCCAGTDEVQSRQVQEHERARGNEQEQASGDVARMQVGAADRHGRDTLVSAGTSTGGCWGARAALVAQRPGKAQGAAACGLESDSGTIRRETSLMCGQS